jgi:very-short-patch-repair endonuclease
MPHTPVSERNRKNAKAMRRVLTDAELKVWNELRAHRLMGLGFRRQVPIAGYIVDFACPANKLIVEVDGFQHGEYDNAAKDTIRTARLQLDGWTVLRFWNDDVIRDVDAVCDHILIAAGLMAEDASRQAEAIAQREAIR